MTAGTMYGVGLGPGDSELLTLKALRLLQRVRYVFLPATTPERSYAGTIAAPYLDPSRHVIRYLVCPPYRDRSRLLSRWAELAEDAAAVLQEGEDAVFLTEGDPSLYSTFQYLAANLRMHYPDVPIVVVPGVTSFTAAAAAAATPLAMWNQLLAIVPGTAPSESVTAALRLFDTTVLLKPSGAMDAIGQLDEVSDADIILARWVGRPEQSIVRGAAALRDAGNDYFSLVIVRKERS
ncbi:MAG: precorrin-2 C(20)-methyltransferase [Dehalococcoidia bacterium]